MHSETTRVRSNMMSFKRLCRRLNVIKIMRDRSNTKREINRRIATGEEERKCHKIGLRGQTDFSGKTG
jgi:hypothetical protein